MGNKWLKLKNPLAQGDKKENLLLSTSRAESRGTPPFSDAFLITLETGFVVDISKDKHDIFTLFL